MKNSTRYMNFMGGRNLLFSLVVFILLGILIYIYDAIAFVFNPLFVILSTVLAPVILAMVMYYLFNPVINFLERHNVKRIWGVIMLFVGIVGVLAALVFLVAPFIGNQVTDLVNNFPDLVEKLQNSANQIVSGTALEGPFTEFTQWLEGWLSDLPANAVDYLGTASSGISTVVSTVSNVLIVVLTFPIIAFFLLKDDKKFFAYVMKLIPPKYRDEVKEIAATMDNQVGSYIKGQLTISFSLGVMVFIGFLIIGLDYAGILALIAGFTSIIPYIGPIIAITPAVIIALTTSWFMVLKLAIVWAVVQFLDGNFVEPNVLGKNLNVHPLTIIVLLLVIGDLLGLVGLLIGVPLYALTRVLVTFVFRKFKQRYNRYYGEEAGEYEDATFSKESYQKK